MLTKNKIFIVGIIICIVIFTIIGVSILINKNREIPLIEYIPQEEISDKQLRQTEVTLYFQNENRLIPEIRKIDVKELIVNPYEKILNLLIEGPKNENLIKIIPDGTKINKIQKEDDILIIDFSNEFYKEEIKELEIKSIVNSLTEFVEINGIKILIDGQENENFKEIYKR